MNLKVWNISDATDRPRNLDLVGQSIRPGKHGFIPQERVKRIQRMIDAGVVYIGEYPPAKYLAAKRKARGQGAARRHRVEMPEVVPCEAQKHKPPLEPGTNTDGMPYVEPEAETTSEAPETLQDDFETMRKGDLIMMCEERGLETEGTKRELIARLQG
jgi:hypothetical protein